MHLRRRSRRQWHLPPHLRTRSADLASQATGAKELLTKYISRGMPCMTKGRSSSIVRIQECIGVRFKQHGPAEENRAISSEPGVKDRLHDKDQPSCLARVFPRLSFVKDLGELACVGLVQRRHGVANTLEERAIGTGRFCRCRLSVRMPMSR